MVLIFALLPGCQFSLGGLAAGGATPDLSPVVNGSDLAGAAAESPTVISTNLVNGAIQVSVNERITATFDHAMEPSTINALTFTLKRGGIPVSGTVVLQVGSNTATFTPAAPLGLGLLYAATITTGAQNTARSALVADYDWSFTTGACSQAAVVLGSAASFAVLAYSTVTNTGPTTITGDLGLSPGSSVTGAPTVTGTRHVADAAAAKGLADLATAYDDAAARTLCPTIVAGDIGGQTLTPGLYRSISSLAISSGDLTLDAQGDADAVFIFQIATSLTTAAADKVVLTRGAKAANVYWQVGTSPSFAATSGFKGTILAHDAISLGAGATLDEGRALSLTAAVNLDSNTIVKPAS
ncbi:MAG: hypothetical protein JWN44_4007 [Myxococcales bacterium]|nr:hypothetical protein [Myxococcales bacterium]